METALSALAWTVKMASESQGQPCHFTKGLPLITVHEMTDKMEQGMLTSLSHLHHSLQKIMIKKENKKATQPIPSSFRHSRRTLNSKAGMLQLHFQEALVPFNDL